MARGCGAEDFAALQARLLTLQTGAAEACARVFDKG
jgi:hypothetical protein